MIRYFSIFWDTIILVIKVNYKITTIYLIKKKYKLLFAANLKLHLYPQLFFLTIYFFIFGDKIIHVIKAKCEIKIIYVIKTTYTLMVVITV